MERSQQATVERYAPIGLWAAATLYYACYARFGNITQDEAWLLESARRVLDGQTPYEDFLSIYAPGRFYVGALLLGWFDDDVMTLRTMWCVLRGGVVALVFTLARRTMTLRFAGAAAATALLLAGPWHKTFFALVPLATLLPLARWFSSGSKRALATAGTIAAVGFWFRQDTGALALGIVTLAAIVAPAPVAPAARHPIATRLLTALGPAGLVIASGALLLSRQTNLSTVIDQIALRAITDGIPRPASTGGPDPAWLLGIVPIALAASVLLPVAAKAIRRRADATDMLLGALSLTILAAFNQVFRPSIPVRFLQCAPLLWPLWYAVWGRAAQRNPDRASLYFAASVTPPIVVGVLITLGIGIHLPREYTGMAHVIARDAPLRLPSGREIAVNRSWAQDVTAMVSFLDSVARPSDPIVVLGWPAALHVLTGRPNPTRLIRFADNTATRAERADAWREIRQHCSLVIVSHRFVNGPGRAWRRLLHRDFAPLRRFDRATVFQRRGPRGGAPGSRPSPR